MKMTRKLIPAFVMLIVSAIMLSTASYAWFANSTTVTATEMSVKANTNVKFLQISSDGSTFGPSASATNKSDDDLNLVTAIVNKEAKTIEWKTASAADPSKPDANTDGLQSADIVKGNFALTNTFHVKMSSETASLQSLKLTGVAVNNAESVLNDALRVLVVAKDENEAVQGIQVWDNESRALIADSSTDSLVATIANGDVYTLVVYIYYDGTDDDAFTNNVTATGANVDAQSVTLTFSGT